MIVLRRNSQNSKFIGIKLFAEMKDWQNKEVLQYSMHPVYSTK